MQLGENLSNAFSMYHVSNALSRTRAVHTSTHKQAENIMSPTTLHVVGAQQTNFA